MEQTQNSEIIFYKSPDGNVHVEVLHSGESVWLPQKRMAELFDVDVRTVNEHLRNTFNSGELDEETTLRKFRIVQQEGHRSVTRDIDFYNLDAIIAVGYRVNSRQATQFRIWATKTLREFIIKGFVIDVDRLKFGSRFGRDYFNELLDRIREIRTSERMFFQRITDIYEQCSIDYDREADITKTFFKAIQNKLHWAITGMTADQIIAERANASSPNMGLTNWKNSPDGKILKMDVSNAKNYLDQAEVKTLDRIVSMYLDYAENQADRRIPMKMIDWTRKLDALLEFNDYDIAKYAGNLSHEVAKKLAEEEFDKFRVEQDRSFESDFDRQIKALPVQ